MTFQKHPKDNLTPKYKLNIQTWVVWNEYDPRDIEEGYKGPSCGGMCLLETFEKMYASDKLVRLESDNWLEVQFTIEAATFEEARTIQKMRSYGESSGYGDSFPCYKCEEFFVFPEGACRCPLCGEIDRDIQADYSELMAKKHLEEKKSE